MSKLSKLLDLYKRGKKISCITAYDASMSKYLDSSGVDITWTSYQRRKVDTWRNYR